VFKFYSIFLFHTYIDVFIFGLFLQLHTLVCGVITCSRFDIFRT